MAMVVITKGSTVIRVPEGAFKKLYEPIGYTIFGQRDDDLVFHVKPEGSEQKEKYITPVAEMTAEQLKEYAEENGIDISDCKSAKEIRRRIRESQK